MKKHSSLELPIETSGMNSVSTIKTTQQSQAQAARSSKSQEKEALMAEFSQLLNSISKEVANQNSDFYLSLNVCVAPAVKKEVAKEASKETAETEETDKEETVQEEESKTEECKDSKSEETSNESSKEVSEEKTEDGAEVVAEPVKEGKAPIEEKKPDDSTESVESKAVKEAAAAEGAQTLGQQIPASEEIAPKPEVKPLENAAVAQVAAKEMAVKEAVAETQKTIMEEEVQTEAAEDAVEAPAEASGETKPDQGTRELIEKLNKDLVEDSKTPLAEETLPGKSGETQTEQQTRTLKAKAEVPQADSDVAAAQEALKKALTEKEMPEKAVANGLEAKAALQQISQPLDDKVRIQPIARSPQFLMSFTREIASLGSTSSSQGNGNPLQGFASTLKSNSSSSTNSTKSSEPLARAVQTKTIERIEEALKEVARSKDGKTISLRLDPPSLGSVKIEVTYKEGTLSAKLVAESQQVNQLIRDKAFELQAVLRKLGLPVESVTVSVGQEATTTSDQSFSSSSQSTSDQQQSAQGSLADLFPDFQDVSSYAEKTKTVEDHWVA